MYLPGERPTHAVLSALDEAALVQVAAGVLEHAEAPGEVLLPLALQDRAAGVEQRAPALALVGTELALVALAVGQVVGALALALVVDEAADVLLGRVEVGVLAVAVFFVATPLAHVDVAVHVDVGALSAFLAVFEAALVGLAVGEEVDAGAVEEVLGPLAVVNVPVAVVADAHAWGQKGLLTFFLPVGHLAVVDAAVFEVHGGGAGLQDAW